MSNQFFWHNGGGLGVSDDILVAIKDSKDFKDFKDIKDLSWCKDNNLFLKMQKRSGNMAQRKAENAKKKWKYGTKKSGDLVGFPLAYQL